MQQIVLLSNCNNVISVFQEETHAKNNYLLEVFDQEIELLGHLEDANNTSIACIVLDGPDTLSLTASLKSNERFCNIPIIILLEKNDRERVLHGYDLHSNSIVVKQEDPAKLKKSVQHLINFWGQINIRP